MVCAGRKNKDSCSGDSGGPLITKTDTDDPEKLIGISSFGGEQCADSKFPGVYARVSARYSTLKDVICETTPKTHPPASFCSDNPVPPTSAPQKTPTIPTTPDEEVDCPMVGNCPDGMAKFEMDLKTDRFGDGDNSMSLVNEKNTKKIVVIKRMERETEYKECKCLLPATRYVFKFADSSKDGFLHTGFLAVYLDGEKVLNFDTKNFPKKIVYEMVPLP